MDGETVIALIAAVAAVGAAYFARREVQEAKRAALAAEEQTRIARQLKIDAAQPYVWVDIRADESQGTVLNLVVGNSGPTVAKKDVSCSYCPMIDSPYLGRSWIRGLAMGSSVASGGAASACTPRVNR